MKSSPLRQTANEQAEFNFYKNRVLELENQVEELTQELRIKHLEAENEQERSECLEIMLKKLGEKDDTTEMLLSELKEENLSLADRVSALQDELMDKELLLRNVQDRCAELENSPDNRDIPQGIDDNHYEIMEAYERTKEELEQKRENVESLEREMNSRTALFQERLSLVERERDELRNSLIVERSKSSYSSLELENKSGEANEHLHRLQHAFSMMQTIFPYFSMAMRDVEGEVHDRLQLLEERLTSSADSLYELSRHYVVRHAEDDDLSNAPIPRSLLEKTLRDTQTALQDALDRHERDEQRFAELEDELGHLNNERHGHLETIQELERQNMNLRNASKNMTTSVSAVEVSDLKARLCAVESRAEKAAAEHAKLYAQHVKVIGYLESECTRLRGLGDHFRAVNSKLMADVKQAQLQGMKAKGLEHRVSMLIESEKTIANKLQVSEKALMERNEEFIALVRDKEAEEMERQRRVEKEVAMYNQQIEDLQHKLLDANRTIDNVTDKLRVHEHEGKLELHHLKLKLDHLEHENMIQSRHTEELEFELRQCREDIRQKDFLLSQSDVKLTLLSQDSVASNSNYERTVKDLAIELEEKLMRVQVLDQALGTMRSRVVEVEAQLLSKDEEITMRLIQKGDLESEVQQLKDMLQEKAAEALELRQTNMFLETERSTLSTRLQALEERYHELTDVNLKQVHDRLIKSDTALRQTMDELESTRNQLDNTDELLEAARFSLSQVEGSLQRLQEEHVMLQTTEQVLRASNETLVEECDYARNQLQEMATQLSLANQKLWSKESELNAAVDQVQEYRQHLSMVEKKYDENRLVLASIETLEIRYVEEVNDLLAQFSNVDDVYDMSVVATPVSTTSSFRDILASPAPNTGMHTPLSANRSPAVVNADINAQLAESIQALRSKSGRVMSQLSSLQHKLREQYNENEHLAKQYDLCRLRLDKAEHDREELQQRYKVSETHVGELKEVATRLQSQTLQIADLTTSRQLQVKDKFVAFGEVLQKSVAHLLQHLDAQKLLNVHVVVSELKETVNTLAIRDDFAVGTDLSVLQSELDSFDHHVEHFFQRGVNVLSLIGGFMEGFAGEKASFVNELERVRGEFETEKQALQQEIDAERTKMTELREDNDRLYDQLNVANEQMQEMTVEMITLRQTNADFEERVGQLEDEIKQSFELNAEMSESLKDAENLQTELQEEIRGLHGELDRKEDSIKTLHDQITTLRRRLSDSDLQVEKVSSVVQRVKAEKEALENVRVSLESELERSRGEYLAILDKFNPVHSEDSGYVFELEKLLAALTSSADQIEDSMGNSDHNTSGEVSVVSSMASGNKHEDRYVEVQRRVEQAVTRLAKIRTRCREDGRNRKLLERQHQSLNDEMKKLLQMLETHQSAAQVAEKRILELETLLEGKDFDIKNFMSDLQHIKNDYNDLVDKCGTYEHTVEQLKKDNIRLSEDVQNKQSEMARVQRSLESCEVTVSRLQAELSTAKMDYQHVLIESEQRAQQLKVAQDNHQKALAALAQAEGSLIRERNSRNEVEGKLHLLEGEAGQAARNKIVHLSAELDRSKEDVRALQHIKIRQEDHIAGLEQELQLSKQQIQALETRIENILKERSSFAEEVAETKRKIQTAKESYELEKSLRLRSEAAIDALKRAQGEDMRKLNMEGLVTIRNNETESLHLLAEEEKRTLRGKIQELKMSCDEKEMLRQHEVHDKKKLEKEVETLQTLLAKRTNDLNTVNTHLSSFRKDGRVVRKQVLEVVSQITELVHKISLDMQLGFVENTSALSSMELKLEAIDTSAGKLPEALGVPALSEAAQKLKEYLTKYFSEHSKLRVQVEKRTDCEAERDALRIQVSSLQEQRSTLLNQHQEEKRALQQQLLRLKNDDSEVGRLLAQIANLEATVKKEKERKERAITELEDVRAEVDRLTGNSLAVRERTSVLGDEAAALHDEVQRLQNENHLLGMELDKMNAHRLALKSTIEVLDKKLKQASEPPLPVDRRVFEHMDMHVTNTVARFQARARAMEELANIYRQSLQTLSPEGPADKLTAYQQVFGDGGGKGGIYIKLAVGWIEKEINTIRTSYDEEIRCLDNQVGELYSKLKEHQAYEDEMRKQLEDYTKSFYRLGSGQTVPMELSHLRKELERALSDLHVLQDELMRERKNSRVRHVKLVEDLTKALEAREVVLVALKRLESYCVQHNLDISGYATFEELHKEAIRSQAAEQVLETSNIRSPYTSRSPSQSAHAAPPQAMSNIIRGLIEADHQLQEAERTHGRSKPRIQASAVRSTSNTRSGLSSTYHAGQAHSSNVVESSLTETFLTSRANHVDIHSTRKESAAGNRVPQSSSRPSSAASSSFSLPTAANSSGQSFIRVTRSSHNK